MPQGGTVTPLEALKAIMNLIGDKDLSDNGELSGAAICDMARAAINSSETTIEETIKITRTAKGFKCESSGIVMNQTYCATQDDVAAWMRFLTTHIVLLLK